MIIRFISLFLLLARGGFNPLFAQAKNPVVPCAVLSASPDTLNFPPIDLRTFDTMTVVIQNTGDLAWSPKIPNISPDDGTFSILSFDIDWILPGESKKVVIQYSPLYSNNNLATITFPNAGPCGNPLAIYLTNQGGCDSISAPDSIIITATRGTKNTYNFSITNNGNFEWHPGTELFAGTGAACFNLMSIVPEPIGSGRSSIFTLEYGLPFSGECCASLSFPNSNPCSNLVNIQICVRAVDNEVKEISNSEGFTLDQNFPNPLASKTSFNYTTPKEAEVNISLNDLNGNLVKTLTKGIVSEGNHLITFDASNLPSGTYIYTLQSGSSKLARELILAK